MSEVPVWEVHCFQLETKVYSVLQGEVCMKEDRDFQDIVSDVGLHFSVQLQTFLKLAAYTSCSMNGVNAST